MKCSAAFLCLSLLTLGGNEAVAQASASEVGRPLFELLGMMTERFSPRPGGTETFGGGDTTSDHFEAILREYCDRLGIEADIQNELFPERHLIEIRSPTIALIEEKFFRSPPDGVGPLYLDKTVFADATDQDLLRYVRGAYLRYGMDGVTASFAMGGLAAANKLREVGLVLSRLGCTDVRLYQTNLNWFGGGFRLLFEPSEIVARAIGAREKMTIEQVAEKGQVPLGDWIASRQIVWSESAWTDVEPPSTEILSFEPKLGDFGVLVTSLPDIDVDWQTELPAISTLVAERGMPGDGDQTYRISQLHFESSVKASGQAVFGDGGVILNPKGPAEFNVLKENGDWRIEEFSPGT